MNEGWEFTTDKGLVDLNLNPQARWVRIGLPHTWNVDDVMDDTPGYFRGEGWYRKNIRISKEWKGKEVYLCFEGANQEVSVYVNRKIRAIHSGGYTAFQVDISPLLEWDHENEIVIKVDNSYNPNIPPLSADFTFYGGIYRELSLLAVDPIHFSLENYGSKSVFIATPKVENKKATVAITGLISNSKLLYKKVSIVSVVRDKQGKQVAVISRSLDLAGKAEMRFEQPVTTVRNPHLWSTQDPYLYQVTTSIKDASGKVIDEIRNTLGFRFFQFDAEKGFILNGKALKLVGTSRHQDYKGMGNALPISLAVKDVELIKEMGGNFLRVAHYPQDQSVLNACDSLGILTSVEIPVVNEITESEKFYDNCEGMQVEMIRQNYNHPSVIIWCYMNEVLLRPHYKDEKEKQRIYFANITRLAKRLDSVTRKEDASRYTMIAHHGDFKKYKEVGLIDIPMIVGWNLYSGWYGSNLADFPAFLDQFHKEFPNKPMTVSEYGADADPRIRSSEPVRFDKSVEYATMFHQYYMKEMMKRPFVAAAMIWNLADFNSETRVESMPHINNKGVMEWNRKPKDIYYYYKAILTEKPFVKILGASSRAAIADSMNRYSNQLLQVASNISILRLSLNGRSIGAKTINNGIAEWHLPLVNGNNQIEVVGEKNGVSFSDNLTLDCRLQPVDLMKTDIPFHQLNVLLGAKRSFMSKDDELWIPSHEYQQGGWGSIGGKPFKIANSGRLPYGTDKDIRGTDDDPVYQTQQIGIAKYRLDVPNGEYELTLHFSELLGGPVKELAYNLDPGDRIEPSGQRVFDVLVNNEIVLEHFNLTAQYGPAAAVSRTVKVSAKDNKGIEVLFKSIEGDPVLNALQLKKLYISKPEQSNVLK